MCSHGPCVTPAGTGRSAARPPALSVAGTPTGSALTATGCSWTCAHSRRRSRSERPGRCPAVSCCSARGRGTPAQGLPRAASPPGSQGCTGGLCVLPRAGGLCLQPTRVLAVLCPQDIRMPTPPPKARGTSTLAPTQANAWPRQFRQLCAAGPRQALRDRSGLCPAVPGAPVMSCCVSPSRLWTAVDVSCAVATKPGLWDSVLGTETARS